jgi:hypothetical protein
VYHAACRRLLSRRARGVLEACSRRAGLVVLRLRCWLAAQRMRMGLHGETPCSCSRV